MSPLMGCRAGGCYMAKKMTRSEFKALLERTLAGEPVYIEGTGVRVRVIRYSKDKRRGRIINDSCTIDFLETPNKKAIDKCSYYGIEVTERTNSTTNQVIQEVDVTANIKFTDLRAVPYKTAAANVLFGSDKENK